MARGGKREGAGRKVGALTKRTREIAEKAIAEGLTPLDYLLGILRDDTKPQEVRIDVAKAAAPYIHARLQATTVNGDLQVEILKPLVRQIVDPAGSPDS